MANAVLNMPGLSSLRLENAFDIPDGFVDAGSSSVLLPSLEALFGIWNHKTIASLYFVMVNA